MGYQTIVSILNNHFVLFIYSRELTVSLHRTLLITSKNKIYTAQQTFQDCLRNESLFRNNYHGLNE